MKSNLIQNSAVIIALTIFTQACSDQNKPYSPPTANTGIVEYKQKAEEIRHEERAEEIKDWCTRENTNDGTPETCVCFGVESPVWAANKYLKQGHRVSLKIIKNSDGKIIRAFVKDYFQPDNGSAFSNFANEHTYYTSIKECKTPTYENTTTTSLM